MTNGANISIIIYRKLRKLRTCFNWKQIRINNFMFTQYFESCRNPASSVEANLFKIKRKDFSQNLCFVRNQPDRMTFQNVIRKCSITEICTWNYDLHFSPVHKKNYYLDNLANFLTQSFSHISFFDGLKSVAYRTVYRNTYHFVFNCFR